MRSVSPSAPPTPTIGFGAKLFATGGGASQRAAEALVRLHREGSKASPEQLQRRDRVRSELMAAGAPADRESRASTSGEATTRSSLSVVRVARRRARRRLERAWDSQVPRRARAALWMLRSRAARQLGRADRAVNNAERGLRAAPGEPTLLRKLADLRFDAGDANLALLLYRLAGVQGDVPAVVRLAQLARTCESHRDLIEAVAQAEARDPALLVSHLPTLNGASAGMPELAGRINRIRERCRLAFREQMHIRDGRCGPSDGVPVAARGRIGGRTVSAAKASGARACALP